MKGQQNNLIVIKLGTTTLTEGTQHISTSWLVEFVRQVAHLHQHGHTIVIVSSGAMAAGKEVLGFPDLPKEIPAKQMLAAIGQPRLMSLYEQIFALFGLTVAQVLLTRTDLADRKRYLNSRNTLAALIDQRVVPIINENDTVATEEIRVGDNDNLSALVANLIEADLLIMLTDQAGVFTADPRRVAAAELIRQVEGDTIPDTLWEAARGDPGSLGTGGMLTKLQAAELARRSGTRVIVASGSEPDILLRLVQGDGSGTHFTPLTTTMESRKRYLLAAQHPPGRIVIDDGAVRALKNGGSLLAVGMVSVSGTFDRGEIIQVVRLDSHEVARGIANYAAADLVRLCGVQSEVIETVLGYFYGDEVIHRDNLVMV